jgi:hypothetical protein
MVYGNLVRPGFALLLICCVKKPGYNLIWMGMETLRLPTGP